MKKRKFGIALIPTAITSPKDYCKKQLSGNVEPHTANALTVPYGLNAINKGIMLAMLTRPMLRYDPITIDFMNHTPKEDDKLMQLLYSCPFQAETLIIINTRDTETIRKLAHIARNSLRIEFAPNMTHFLENGDNTLTPLIRALIKNNIKNKNGNYT